VLFICFLANISLGSVFIPIKDIFIGLFGGSLDNESWQYIIQNYRLPKAFTAIIVGSGLGISGLLMQTLFKNPLAGPFVLGISSGASLGVALVIMGSGLVGGFMSTLLLSQWSLVIAASLGSFLVLLAVVIVSIRVRDTMAILIIGLMFGSITAAIVSVLSYFSSAEQLQQYIFWGFGSLGNLSWKELGILFLIYSIGLILSIYVIKRLKGLAIPHLTRQIFKTSNHKILLPAVFLYGAIVMLICDSIAQLPLSDYTLPINAITSLIGVQEERNHCSF